MRDDPTAFRAGARDADAVVHLANKHDWADPEGNDRVQFGAVGHFFGRTMTGSSRLTRERLGWQPVAPSLIEDIVSGAYSAN